MKTKPLNATAIRRLTKIRDMLRDEVPNEQFNIEVWSDSRDLDLPQNQAPKIGCNMAGCVGGWTPACFPRSTFRFTNAGYVTYRGEYHFSAMAKFYNIHLLDAIHIASSGSYRSGNPKRMTVVNRITKFLEAGVRRIGVL